MDFENKQFQIVVKQGLKDNLEDLFNVKTARRGELFYTTDTKELFIADADGGDSPNFVRLAQSTAVTVSASTYDTVPEANIIFCDTSSNGITVTLSSADCVAGRQIVIKDTGNAGSNNITVNTEGSETIDGSASDSISTNYGVLHLVSDGSNWFIL